MQQNPERVDIGSGRYDTAIELLRRGITRCQCGRSGTRRFILIIGEQLGDAKIKQFHLAFDIDEDV